MDFSENGIENRSKSTSKFRKTAKKQVSCELLKADLARCRCGMNMGDGALKYPLVVLSNSTIKIGGCPSGFCRKRNSNRQTLHSQDFKCLKSQQSLTVLLRKLV